MDIRTVVVLIHADRVLLLRRASWKKLFPNRWTGLGGKVEPEELGDPLASAQRELFEETDLRPDELRDLRIQRALLMEKPDEGLLCLLYITGRTISARVPSCNDGSLAWVEPAALPDLDLIENTAAVLPRLIEDARKPSGRVLCGTARYDDQGRLLDVTFVE